MENIIGKFIRKGLEKLTIIRQSLVLLANRNSVIADDEKSRDQIIHEEASMQKKVAIRTFEVPIHISKSDKPYFKAETFLEIERYLSRQMEIASQIKKQDFGENAERGYYIGSRWWNTEQYMECFRQAYLKEALTENESIEKTSLEAIPESERTETQSSRLSELSDKQLLHELASHKEEFMQSYKIVENYERNKAYRVLEMLLKNNPFFKTLFTEDLKIDIVSFIGSQDVKARAEYVHSKNQIKITTEAIDSLVFSDDLGTVLTSLFHEYTHRLQFSFYDKQVKEGMSDNDYTIDGLDKFAMNKGGFDRQVLEQFLDLLWTHKDKLSDDVFRKLFMLRGKAKDYPVEDKRPVREALSQHSHGYYLNKGIEVDAREGGGFLNSYFLQKLLETTKDKQLIEFLEHELNKSTRSHNNAEASFQRDIDEYLSFFQAFSSKEVEGIIRKYGQIPYGVSGIHTLAEQYQGLKKELVISEEDMQLLNSFYDDKNLDMTVTSFLDVVGEDWLSRTNLGEALPFIPTKSLLKILKNTIAELNQETDPQKKEALISKIRKFNYNLTSEIRIKEVSEELLNPENKDIANFLFDDKTRDANSRISSEIRDFVIESKGVEFFLEKLYMPRIQTQTEETEHYYLTSYQIMHSNGIEVIANGLINIGQYDLAIKLANEQLEHYSENPYHERDKIYYEKKRQEFQSIIAKANEKKQQKQKI